MRGLYKGLIGATILVAISVSLMAVLGIGPFYDRYANAGGKFDSVYGVATDSAGNVYVLDIWHHRLHKLDDSGGFIEGWSTNATDVAVDSSGNIFALAEFDNRVTKYSSSGTLLGMWGSRGSSTGQFSGPQDIALDSKGNVFVADTGNNRVQKFSPDGEYLLEWVQKAETKNKYF